MNGNSLILFEIVKCKLYQVETQNRFGQRAIAFFANEYIVAWKLFEVTNDDGNSLRGPGGVFIWPIMEIDFILFSDRGE